MKSKRTNPPRILSLRIQGYRPFRDFAAKLDSLEVLVGANGSGKSCLFEFLRFIRNSVDRDIPPEIVSGSIGQQIFHKPGDDRFLWNLEMELGIKTPISYQCEIMGPVGRCKVISEEVKTVQSCDNQKSPMTFLVMRDQHLSLNLPKTKKSFAGMILPSRRLNLSRPNQLAISTMTTPNAEILYDLREYILRWRFYSSFNINHEKIRRSVPINQEPILYEDAGNLSSVLHFLMTEHPQLFKEVHHYLQLAIPGFQEITVKARGGPGEVIAFWKEEGIDSELSLADLSDGILHFICWIVLCLQPKPPTLICIDEPDQGVHPRTLPILAGLFEKACEKTQILLATHASYFLMHFDISRIAVMRKENGEAKFFKPKDSKALTENLKDFGQEEIELMHRSDELELLA